MQHDVEEIMESENDQREEESEKFIPNNLLMFKAALSKVFEDIADCVSEEEYLKIITVLKSQPKVVKKLRQVMKDDLTKGLQDLVEEIVEDECLVEGMTKLTKLNEETTTPANVKLWRPPGDVNLHLRSLDAEIIKNECEKLKSYISDLNKENQEMMTQITARRESIQNVNNRMKKLINMPFKLSEMESNVKLGQECVEKLYTNEPNCSNK